MGSLSEMFLGFIADWGYLAVAVLMGMENACIPIPSELILGFAGYLIFAGKMTFTGALVYGMIGGQTADVEETEHQIELDKLIFIHENKTSALIECAMMIGAILAGASEQDVKDVEGIARKIGLAFQIQDDILDLTSTQEELGKPVGSDEKNQKNTYVSLKGMEQSVQDVQRYTNEAIQSFDNLGYSNEFLRSLLLYLSGRKK